MSTLRNKNANEGVHNDILSFGSMYLTIPVQLLRTKKKRPTAVLENCFNFFLIADTAFRKDLARRVL